MGSGDQGVEPNTHACTRPNTHTQSTLVDAKVRREVKPNWEKGGIGLPLAEVQSQAEVLILCVNDALRHLVSPLLSHLLGRHCRQGRPASQPAKLVSQAFLHIYS